VTDEADAGLGGLTLADLKQRIDVRLTGVDDMLRDYLIGALEQAQAPPPNGCGRLLIPNPATADDDPVTLTLQTFNRYVRVPDAREITEVLVDDVEATDYVALSQNDHIVQLTLSDASCAGHLYPFTGVYRSSGQPRIVKVTGRFGFETIPKGLREAIYILAGRAYYERQAQYADQVVIGETGATQAYYRQLPPRTKLTFSTYTVAKGLGGLA
jgi:hypothetical protein